MVGLISMRRPSDYMPIARRYGLSAVGVGTWAPSSDFSGLPYVDVDPKAIGEMAAEYFVERGFRNFGMFATEGSIHSRYRGEAFVAALRRRKLPCDVFDPKKKYPPCGKPSFIITDYNECIRRWLVGLAKPLAVFAIDDPIGAWICTICQQSDICVPEEVAILGADNDDTYCDTSRPPLSSIRIPAEQVGYKAAKLLDAMFQGRKVPKRPFLLPPMDVVTRQSTDVMAIENHYVVRAVRFIREHAHEGIDVERVVEEAGMSRRMLERKFRAVLDRSPFEEIRRVRIENLKTLLSQTDKTLETIAPECGFVNVARMGLTFREATGMTPGTYRKQFRSR